MTTLPESKLEIISRLLNMVNDWLAASGKARSTPTGTVVTRSTKRRNRRPAKNARSTLAGAIVTLDTIRIAAPFSKTDLFTDGGQLVNGRGLSLKATLQRYGEEREYLADGVTTRSTLKFERLAEAINWGGDFADWTAAEREVAAVLLVAPVKAAIDRWFEQQHMTIRPDRQNSPLAWIEELLEKSKDRSQGRVEQHLVWSKLKVRFPELVDADHAAFAGDMQTGRYGDIAVGDVVFHVTAAPALPVIDKCGRNLQAGQHPILVVPRYMLERAKGIAQVHTPPLHKRITFVAIEDFLATNIVELAGGESRRFIDVLKSILDEYNDAITTSETDKSLRIEIN